MRENVYPTRIGKPSEGNETERRMQLPTAKRRRPRDRRTAAVPQRCYFSSHHAALGVALMMLSATTSHMAGAYVPPDSFMRRSYSQAVLEFDLRRNAAATGRGMKMGSVLTENPRKSTKKTMRRQRRPQESSRKEVLQVVEDEDTTTSASGIIPSMSHLDTTLPPWLATYQMTFETNGDFFSNEKVQQLKDALIENGFSKTDMREIMGTLLYYFSQDHAGNSISSPLVGIFDFIHLILDDEWDVNGGGKDVGVEDHKMHKDLFATKEVVLAAIVHYAECMKARQQGIYDVYTQRQKPMSQLELPAGKPIRVVASDNEDSIHVNSMVRLPLCPEIFSSSSASSSSSGGLELHNGVSDDDDDDDDHWLDQECFEYEDIYQETIHGRAPVGKVVRKIATSAGRIKRAEVMANSILGLKSRRLTHQEAANLRGLLLSSMDDWRALTIRCIACLFRLNGIIQHMYHGGGGHMNCFIPDRQREMLHSAHEGLHVYATLAERLGMHRLKAKIEERSFQILYRRQFRVVESMYSQSGEEMHAISKLLWAQVNQLLRNDDRLMGQLGELKVSARVKDPYSFWKKLLKKRFGKSSVSNGLSILDVHDGIALRVVLEAKKDTPNESEGLTRARERLLCYYVQHLIRTKWKPMSNGSGPRTKDYIQFPKPNGYQSLHYTATMTYHGQRFPFEVQVRSKEMHEIAEYGVAAHWDYKVAAAAAAASVTTNHALAGADTNDKENSVITLASSNAIDVSSSSGTNNGTQLDSERRSYIDALQGARQNLMRTTVYVFVSGAVFDVEQGQLINLDHGARVEDALEYLQENAPELCATTGSSSTQKTPTVWRNGQEANERDRIGNGDVILIEF